MIRVRFPEAARKDVGIKVSEQSEKEMCVGKEIAVGEKKRLEMKKAIGGEKREKEKLSEKKERGRRSRNAWQSNKLRRVAISRKKAILEIQP